MNTDAPPDEMAGSPPRRRRSFLANRTDQRIEPPVTTPSWPTVPIDEDLPVLTEFLAGGEPEEDLDDTEVLPDAGKAVSDDARIQTLAAQRVQALEQDIARELPALVDAALQDVTLELPAKLRSALEKALHEVITRRQQLSLPLESEPPEQ